MRGRTAVLLVIALASLAADKEAPKKGPPDLQGTWRLVSIERNGEARTFDDNPSRWVVKGNEVRYGGEELATLKVDPETTPKCLDLHFVGPGTDYEGVYKVEKDTLTVCLGLPGDGAKERPLEFVTKDKPNVRLLVFRRDKAGSGDGPEGGMGWLGVQIRKGEDHISIADVFKGSPAQRAGLKKDDVLLKVGDADATELLEVVRTIQRARPGSELAFVVKRGGKEQTVKAKIGVLPFHFLLG